MLSTSHASGVQQGPTSSIPPQLRDDELSLVHRATFGFTPSELERARSMGFEAWRDEQLDPTSIDDSTLDAVLSQVPSLAMDAADLLANFPAQAGGDNIVAQHLVLARLIRARYSNRQLWERVVEFWTDHFNIDQGDTLLRYLKTVDDRIVAREHGLGTFRDLLGASAKSGAMLVYLNNATNVALAPNENYARELMELHTLGVDGGYTEQDVLEVARCFTGWSIRPITSPDAAEFVFRPMQHDNGAKTVLGVDIPAGGGQQDGETVLDILAAHPSTAAHLARKLCVFFLSYDPPLETVERVAQVFTDTGGDLLATVREVLTKRSFAEASVWTTLKLKRPLHFVIAALRAAGANLTEVQSLSEQLVAMGQRPFAWPAPNGFPDSLGAWGANLLPRWNFASELMDGAIPGVGVPGGALSDLVGGVPPAEVAGVLNSRLTGGRMTPVDVQQVQSFVEAQPGYSGDIARQAIALALSMPSFQWL